LLSSNLEGRKTERKEGKIRRKDEKEVRIRRKEGWST
jgi:hypothetical protein